MRVCFFLRNENDEEPRKSKICCSGRKGEEAVTVCDVRYGFRIPRIRGRHAMRVCLFLRNENDEILLLLIKTLLLLKRYAIIIYKVK